MIIKNLWIYIWKVFAVKERILFICSIDWLVRLNESFICSNDKLIRSKDWLIRPNEEISFICPLYAVVINFSKKIQKNYCIQGNVCIRVFFSSISSSLSLDKLKNLRECFLWILLIRITNISGQIQDI